ncbi:hypothetical protein PMAYCL1PPCAC_09960, partial [Pristionchus mayeri]
GNFRYIRFVILAVSVLHLAFIQASGMAFNTAFVVLSDRKSSPLYDDYEELVNRTGSANISFDWSPSYLPLAQRRYPFDAVQRSFTFAASFAGGLLGTFPMLYVLRKLGAHMTMIIVGAVSSLLCDLTPQSISASFELFVGFATVPVFPVLGDIIEQWAGVKETGLFVAILSSHMEIASLFVLPVGSLIAEKVNWPTVFYVHGLICVFFTISWLFVYRDISLPKIQKPKSPLHVRNKHHDLERLFQPPYRAIFSSTSIWAVFISAIGTIFVGQFMGIFSPQYFTSVLGYSPTLTGTLTIIPTIAQLPLKAIAGVASDKLKLMSEVCKLRLFNSLACYLGGAIFVVIICVPPAMNTSVATVLIMIPFILGAFTTGGFHKAAIMISRQHASFIFGIVHVVATLSLISGSFIIPLITPDNTFHQWRIVFIIFIAVLIISNTFFIIFARAEPEEWAEMKIQKEFSQLSEEPR